MRWRGIAIGGVLLALGLGPAVSALADDLKQKAKSKAEPTPPAADACADVCRRGQGAGVILVDGEKTLYKICFEAGRCAPSGFTLKKVYEYTPPGLFDPLTRMLPGRV